MDSTILVMTKTDLTKQSLILADSIDGSNTFRISLLALLKAICTIIESMRKKGIFKGPDLGNVDRYGFENFGIDEEDISAVLVKAMYARIESLRKKGIYKSPDPSKPLDVKAYCKVLGLDPKVILATAKQRSEKEDAGFSAEVTEEDSCDTATITRTQLKEATEKARPSFIVQSKKNRDITEGGNRENIG
ncbi:hypothetical protein K440DRAFT_637893 [Wilcoxina mikolae CBS 423.85]|nr:hypothetical protein K440DRAFT_637893 [Wilcoxina mikolae CBS 423.85]